MKNLSKEPTANCFSAMHGNNRASSIRMTEDKMAATRANRFEPQFMQGSDDLPTGDSGEVGHDGMVTRWMPMNLLETGSSTSRQSAMTS